jgi:cytochrome P450
MATYPKSRLRDLGRLIGLLVKTRIRRGDLAEAVTGWLRGLTQRYQSPNVVIDLIFRRVLLVSGHALSAHVLTAVPSSQGFVAGTMKRKAMSFLAPHALTILHDTEWHTFRSYNEEVLQTGSPHPHLPTVLAEVRKLFSGPVNDLSDIRQPMGRLMLAVVFGEGNAPARLIDEVNELFAEVGLKTALFGSRKGALRDQFHGELRRLWESGVGTAHPTLLARAHQAAETIAGTERREALLLEQIPHWMFTFTNSGSDLLARSLAMIAARPDCFARVGQEIASAGPLERPENIYQLRYLEACIRETGRLYPPVVLTAHRAAQNVSFEGVEIPAATEMLQYFPLTNRDTSLDPLAGHFRPERWLNSDDPIHKRETNLFLSGARACPGRDMILFVEKAAIAMLVQSGGIQGKRNVLTVDPVPFSFPPACLQFGRGGVSALSFV